MLDHAREAVEMAGDRTVDDFRANRQLNLALVRLIEIIGEAANRTSDDFRAKHASIPWRDIIAMRNRVIHGYDSVDLKVVWDVIHFDLPPLIEQLKWIVSESGER